MAEVTMALLLEAREGRVRRQRALLAEFGCPVICFTMNIPGPEKTGPEIARAFEWGDRMAMALLEQAGLPCRAHRETRTDAGYECLYAVNGSAVKVKTLMTELEESRPVGRLLDLDVLDEDGNKVEREAVGLPPRQCLICGGPARICARSRAHGLDALRQRTGELLRAFIREEDAGEIARLACRSLLYEVCVTPKPGLVDRLDAGSHRDMDIFTFMTSASGLWPYFRRCAEIGMALAELPPVESFGPLRRAGRLAEAEMYRHTGGVNTHKGAIFSLGIACAAAGRLSGAQRRRPEAVVSACAAIAKGVTAKDFAGLNRENVHTAGQRLYLETGLTGVRGQVEAGFPAVLEAGLPRLEECLEQGRDWNDAGRAALLALMAAEVDTNLVARGGLESARWASREAAALLAREPCPEAASLEALNRRFVEKNLSPGGSADLLAVCCFLRFLKTDL